MAEYIERNKVLDICEKHYQHCLEMHDYCGDTTADNIKEDIEKLPTADVVPVVRCKDCKYYNVYRLECHNPHHNGIINCEGYCSYGERRCEE
jgi:hypothetical protein